MQKEQLLFDFIEWIFLWILFWGIFKLFLLKHIDYIKRYMITALYFLGVTIIVAFIFKNDLTEIIAKFSTTPFIILGIVIIFHIFLYSYIPKYIKEPKKYFEKFPERQYLSLSFKRLFSKSLDILAQQIFIVLLAIFLQSAGLNLIQTILIFSAFFGIAHIPLIFIENSWPSWYFTFSAILSAVLFPVLIIEIPYGFIYSYIVHWLFYTITAVGFWIIYNKS
jgi:hypothetical protein